MGSTSVSLLVGLGLAAAAAPSTFVVSLKQRDAAESPVRTQTLLTKDLARHPVGVRLVTIEAEKAGVVDMPNATLVPLPVLRQATPKSSETRAAAAAVVGPQQSETRGLRVRNRLHNAKTRRISPEDQSLLSRLGFGASVSRQDQQVRKPRVQSAAAADPTW
jgi:hypothetical protein